MFQQEIWECNWCIKKRFSLRLSLLCCDFYVSTSKPHCFVKRKVCHGDYVDWSSYLSLWYWDYFLPFLLRCRRHENDMLLHLKDMRDPICAILPRLIELAALGIVQLHSQVLERHTISASSCFLFETKLPAFALSSGFFLLLLLLRIGKVSTLSFCVLCKWRELASRNVNQCKSIMEAICEVCEEWQNSLGTYKQLCKYTHIQTHHLLHLL